MNTKITLDKFSDLNVLLKSKLLRLLFDSKTYNHQYAFILFLIFNVTILQAQSNSCRADLKVEKNRNTRSTPLDGTYYSMIITNNGNTSDEYTLATQNLGSPCINTDRSDSSTNVLITTKVLDSNLNPLSRITVNAGQTIRFLIHVTVPTGTIINRWNCTQVIARSRNCSSYSTDTVLHTLVINSNED